MISVIITSFKEPEIIGRAIQAVLKNKTKRKYEVIVAAPDEPTAQVIKKYVKKDKRVSYFRDKGKGKVGALNELFVRVKSEILILTDGDVWIGENAIEELAKALDDPQVGCVTGRPVAANDKNTMLGYWSHLLVDAGAHKIREKLNKQKKFIECSGYLFAFKNKIRKIPVDVAEDSIIPYLLWKQGYKIKYVPEAEVHVKYPNTLKDFIKQRVRTVKSHEKLKVYAPDFPTVKSFANELTKGPLEAIKYPKKIKEVIWTLCLFPIRLYIWYRAEKQRKSGKTYQDNWERIESTK